MKIRADTSKCIGAAQCVVFSDTHFSQDEDGFVCITDSTVNEQDEIDVEEAVESCPSGALSLE